VRKALCPFFQIQLYLVFERRPGFFGKQCFNAGYVETDKPDPISVVGKTFALAEKEIAKARRHSIVRLGFQWAILFKARKVRSISLKTA